MGRLFLGGGGSGRDLSQELRQEQMKGGSELSAEVSSCPAGRKIRISQTVRRAEVGHLGSELSSILFNLQKTSSLSAAFEISFVLR